jgi:hypothetical protein
VFSCHQKSENDFVTFQNIAIPNYIARMIAELDQEKTLLESKKKA